VTLRQNRYKSAGVSLAKNAVQRMTDDELMERTADSLVVSFGVDLRDAGSILQNEKKVRGKK